MKLEGLVTAFSRIRNELILKDYISEICDNIINNKATSRENIDDILIQHNIEDDIAVPDLLHLILEYIKRALEDDNLLSAEKENIKFLKVLFRIEEGDFYFYLKEDIERIIGNQLYKIYRDKMVTQEEALLKVDIQEIFDLTFDQMNEYSKSEALVAIARGADICNLDVLFTHKEYFKLKPPL